MKRFWSSNLATLVNQKSTTSSNPSKNYWFTNFNAFLISLYFRVVLVNTARPDGAFPSNLVTLVNQKSTTSSCIDNFCFCLSINKNGRIIPFQFRLCLSINKNESYVFSEWTNGETKSFIRADSNMIISSNLVTLVNQKSTTISCIDNFFLCLSVNKNGRIIRETKSFFRADSNMTMKMSSVCNSPEFVSG
jgi:hypothetical protein